MRRKCRECAWAYPSTTGGVTGVTSSWTFLTGYLEYANSRLLEGLLTTLPPSFSCYPGNDKLAHDLDILFDQSIA